MVDSPTYSSDLDDSPFKNNIKKISPTIPQSPTVNTTPSWQHSEINTDAIIIVITKA